MGDRSPGRRRHPTLSHIQPGTVLRLDPDQWKYGTGPLTLQVTRVRHDLNRYYDDEAWIEGYRLDASGAPVAFVQALVRLDALT